MDTTNLPNEFLSHGLDQSTATKFFSAIHPYLQNHLTPEQKWQQISQVLTQQKIPFAIHLLLFKHLFPSWPDNPCAAAWLPQTNITAQANITHFLQTLNLADVKTLHQWTIDHYASFWQKMLAQLNIICQQPPTAVCQLTHGIETPQWLPGAKINISDSCFTAPTHATAIIYQDQKKIFHTISYGELDQLSNRIANSLQRLDFTAGDPIAIAMPMNHYAVAIYLGIIKMGVVVVSIPDSFSHAEMATRLRIAKAKAVFTQDFIYRGTKQHPLYEKLRPAMLELNYQIIVLPGLLIENNATFHTNIPLLDPQDITWHEFLSANEHFQTVACDPMTACNILFSSGTTSEPKAIVWNHTTPIKAASDGFFQQNIQAGDIICWPTNLGWMMGPWLIYATFINHATLALYTDPPKDQTFGEFVQEANVTILGVVPTLVASWRQSQCMEKVDWSKIKLFTSTGESSNPQDMLYLMHLAGYKPVIEYCGGTEIGGAYLSSTVIEKNCPALFSTPTMGMNLVILDENKQPATAGEVTIIPPSIGLSTQLLNADHHHVYYADMPSTAQGIPYRRHGDQIEQVENGYFSILGRVDDSMNLGGIKTSAVEIERILIGVEHIVETAAVAIPPPQNGPSLLVIFAVADKTLDVAETKKIMQQKINAHLNPLFKIHDVVFLAELPKTATNKIMRRVLRKKYF